MVESCEAHDGSHSEKCFVRMKICFLYARTKGVVFYHACLLHCGEYFWIITLHEVCMTGES